MSKGNNKNGLFVDTGLLRDHVSKLREEKKMASRLRDSVLSLKNMSDPTISYKYDPILRDINHLIEYFGRMADTLARINDEAVQLSNELGAMIQDSTDETRHTSLNTFML